MTDLERLPNRTKYDGKLILFSAFYGHMGHAPYLSSMVQAAIVLERMGIAWDYWFCYSDFHFDRALNKAMVDFMRSDATDIILIDTDIQFEAESLFRLLSHDVDVICGSYREKNNWERYVGEYIVAPSGAPAGKVGPDGKPILAASRIPGGFTRFTKRAVQLYYDERPDLHYMRS